MQKSTITRRRILQGAATVTAASLLPGCGSSSTPGTSSPVTPLINPQPIPAAPYTAASLTVSANVTGQLGSAFVGLSYDKLCLTEGLFTGSNTDLIGLFKLLGPSVLRFGDGSNSVWNPNGVGKTAGQIAPADVTACAAFLKATGWQCMYGVNLGGAAPGWPYPSNPALAAEEVAYVSQAFGSSLLGIEIGNEVDNYGYYGGPFYGKPWSLSVFETLWNQFRTAILASTPTVNVTGPCVTQLNIPNWIAPFAQTYGKDIDLLTTHYYRGNGALPTSTAAALITPDPTLVNSVLQPMDQIGETNHIPYRITECNSYYSGSAGVSNSYASSLWAIDFLFNGVQGGSTGTNFHGGEGTSYTPIEDNTKGTVLGAAPLYYGLLLFALAGEGTLYTSTLNAGSLNATAYAVKTATGLNIIVNNKDLAQNLELSIQLPQTAHTATLIEMTQSTAGAGPSLAAASGVSIQGASVSIAGGFTPNAPYTLVTGSTQLTCYVPYLSAVLIQIM